MAILNFDGGLNQIKANIINKNLKVDLNTFQLQELPEISSNQYFNDSTEWGMILFEYEHTSGQKHRITFKNDGYVLYVHSFIKFGPTAQLGTWTLKAIVVIDWDNKVLFIDSSNVPTDINLILS